MVNQFNYGEILNELGGVSPEDVKKFVNTEVMITASMPMSMWLGIAVLLDTMEPNEGVVDYTLFQVKTRRLITVAAGDLLQEIKKGDVDG